MDCHSLDLDLSGAGNCISNYLFVSDLVPGFRYIGQSIRLVLHCATLKTCLSRSGRIIDDFSLGLLIPGFGYLVTNGRINQDGFLFFIPLMLYGLAFILTVELPDMESDRLGRKMTWVAQKTFRKTFGYPGCQWDHDHSCGFLNPGGWNRLFC